MKKPKKKYIVGALATIVVVGAIEGARRFKNWKYWERAIEEIPWPR